MKNKFISALCLITFVIAMAFQAFASPPVNSRQTVEKQIFADSPQTVNALQLVPDSKSVNGGYATTANVRITATRIFTETAALPATIKETRRRSFNQGDIPMVGSAKYYSPPDDLRIESTKAFRTEQIFAGVRAREKV